MRILAVGAVVIAMVLAQPRPAGACSCRQARACERLFSGPVFVGKAVKVKRDKKQTQQTTFKVSEVLNGIVGKTAVVTTGTDDGMCGYSFELGKEYIVYAHEDGGVLWSGSCTGTALAAYAAEDLAYARALPKRDKAVVDGFVAAQIDGGSGRVKVPNATVRVLGTQITTKTDHEGAFHLDLAPGKHSLEVIAADLIMQGREAVVVELPHPASCALAELDVEYNGRIAGRITDRFGKPAPGIRVGAVDAIGSLQGNFLATTKDDGTYEIDGVMEGSYRVGVSLPGYGGPDVRASYPTTYYPGTPDPLQAKVVVIARAKKVAKIDFAIPGRLPVFRVSGTILSAIGLPAAAQSVSIDVPGSFGTSTTTDDQGHYTYDIVSGRELVVRVCNAAWKCAEARHKVMGPIVIDLRIPH